MTEGERRQIVLSLATLVRRLGWEDLIAVQITPEDAERGDVDASLTRDLVAQVAKVVRDLDALEWTLMSIPNVTGISFKPDLGDDTANLDKVRFDRGHQLQREQQIVHRQIFRELRNSLSALEAEFDVG